MKYLEQGKTYIALRSVGPFQKDYAYTAYWWGTTWFKDEVEGTDFMFNAPKFNVLLTKGFFEEA